jgi:hypothetical protein
MTKRLPGQNMSNVGGSKGLRRSKNIIEELLQVLRLLEDVDLSLLPELVGVVLLRNDSD